MLALEERKLETLEWSSAYRIAAELSSESNDPRILSHMSKLVD
jgi:hypothetical protein